MQGSSTPHKADEKRGLLWPGIQPPFNSPFGRQRSAPCTVGASPSIQKPRFSFDWTRGRNGKSEHSLGGVLAGWGEGGFSSRQRWKPFILLLMLSLLMFVLAAAFLPLVLMRPQKFCLFFTLGSMLNMASFAVLRGPVEQLKHMFSVQRLPFTSTYVGSMILTLYAALVIQSYVLVLLFSCLQGAALSWYLLSYVPGGAPFLKVISRYVSRGMRAICCSCGQGGTSLLPL
ncbi:hypothetical protein AB1Y20_008050 [Prymnesium parvum]|uniref:Vesicle transport protein n=1 Tax=Prymnesium parvum TaxID=97485 RepID=A0AB34IWQ9_PRYPA|mmetsp:Transcript_5498/g.14044  ORF Transcript_5498/g.14044 Transcript_5498/m.14044 type:complete len:230 (-) Transcript_5498:100-789(-)